MSAHGEQSDGHAAGPAGLTIRPERPGDRDEISAVVAAVFGSPLQARLVDAIRDSDNVIPELSLVAETEDRVVGHVMISYVGLDAGSARCTIPSLSPLAVAPPAQGQGIGTALVHAVIRAADRRGEPLVVLEGAPNYYRRFGFECSVPLGIEIRMPSWAPPEAAQLLRLRNYDPSLRGRVIYPPAFDEASHD